MTVWSHIVTSQFTPLSHLTITNPISFHYKYTHNLITHCTLKGSNHSTSHKPPTGLIIFTKKSVHIEPWRDKSLYYHRLLRDPCRVKFPNHKRCTQIFPHRALKDFSLFLPTPTFLQTPTELATKNQTQILRNRILKGKSLYPSQFHAGVKQHAGP